MDYCLAVNQIGNYAPASGGGGGSCCDPLVVKNIDCVSLESDTVTCNNLTIDGNPITASSISDLQAKTQNQTATALPPTTSFGGKLQVEDLNVVGGSLTTLTLNTDTIQPFTSGSTIAINAPISVTGSITSGDRLSVNNTTSTTGTTLASFFQTKLGDTTPQTTQATSIVLGKSTNAGESAYIRYTRDTNSTNNNLGFGVTGYNPVQIFSSYMNIPTELRIVNNILRPRITTSIGTLSGSQVTLVSSLPTPAAGLRRVIIMLKGLQRSTTAPPYILFNDTLATTATYAGVTWGNNTTTTQAWSSGTSGIKLWNATTTPAAQSGYTIAFDMTINLDYMGTIGGLETWTVSGQGNDHQTNISTPTLTTSIYWVNFSGTVNLKTAGVSLSSLLIRAVSADTGTFQAGSYSVMYY
jgi:hypothetical protein